MTKVRCGKWDDVVHSSQLPGFYIVRLSFSQAGKPDDSLVLGRRELHALYRERNLKPLPPL